MRARRRFLLFVCVVATALLATPFPHQVRPVFASPMLDSKGTDFWLMFPQNFLQPLQPTLSLFITSDVTTSGTVEIPGLSFSESFDVIAGTVTTVSIPIQAHVTTSDEVETKGIHVTALDEVTVYGLSQAQNTTDAFLGLPTDILGMEYINLGYRNGGAIHGTQFGIVATENDTTVTITPSVDTGSHIAGESYTAGVPYNITLQQGETYQLRNTLPGDSASPNDLSGTILTSDKPIAVFGSHLCANIPPGLTACDHIVEQLPPTVTWGKTFVTEPLATRIGGDTFRFLASVDDTTVNVNGAPVATLDRGQVHEQIIVGQAVIDANEPILVAQYSNSTEFDEVTSDPFMMLIPPFEQFLADYTITTPDVVFEINFVNVVAPDAAVDAISLDGSPIPADSFTPIGASGFSGAQLKISVGSHRLTGPLPFGVFVYGFAFTDSYGYPGGMSLAPVASVTTIALEPAEATNTVGERHCVVATVLDQNNEAVGGVRVDFSVTGANPIGGFANANDEGQAQFCYTGNTDGLDTIVAAVGAITSNQATKTWTAVAPPVVVTTIQLAPKTATNPVDTEHCVVATVHRNGTPADGVDVDFTVTGANEASGIVPADENGEARFCYTGTNPGDDTIVASLDTISDTATKTWEADVAFTCPRSQGFWKTHPNAWPVDSLMLGSKSYTKNKLLKILKTPVRGDASIILAYQLIAAKLNIENGSDPDPINDTIDYADRLLGYKRVPQKIKTSSSTGKKMTSAASILDRYNNGKLTPDCIPGKKTAKAKKKLKLKLRRLLVKDKDKNKGHALQKVKEVKEKVKGLAVGLQKKNKPAILLIKPKSRGK